MDMFKTRDDVEEWLAPMNYEEFWIAIKPWCLVLPTRARCDADIAAGADIEDVKIGLKMIAGRLLAKRHNLTRRPHGPVLRVVSLQD
jgi:hypothetical protein